jgi:hypothetical protein
MERGRAESRADWHTTRTRLGVETQGCSGSIRTMLRTLPSRTLSINAVHEDNARELLEALGVAGSFDDGSLKCTVCDEPVRDLGLGVARRRGDEVVFSCARLDCMRTLS